MRCSGSMLGESGPYRRKIIVLFFLAFRLHDLDFRTDKASARKSFVKGPLPRRISVLGRAGQGRVRQVKGAEAENRYEELLSLGLGTSTVSSSDTDPA